MIFDNGAWAQGKRYRLKVVKAIGGRTLVRRGTFAADEPRSRTSRKDPTTYATSVWNFSEEPLTFQTAEVKYDGASRVNHAAYSRYLVSAMALSGAFRETDFESAPFFISAPGRSLFVNSARKEKENRNERIGEVIAKGHVVF